MTPDFVSVGDHMTVAEPTASVRASDIAAREL
jgi:hypothetical protein